MTESTRDQAEGKAHEIKGTVKKAVGLAVGNPQLEAEGAAEKLAGQIQGKLGQVERVLGK